MKNLIYKLPLDKSIIYLMLFLLPIDMVNGFLLTNNIILPISISQAFKMLIVLLIFLNLAKYPKQFFLSIFIILVLMVPSFFQLFKNLDFSLLMNDLIKITKYVIPIFAFLFFRNYLKKNTSRLVFKLVNFSYFILVINILLKHLGIGYPMYSFGDIGSKGFFYAGNEISALLLILSSIVSFNIWNQNKYVYVLIALLNVIVALTISSKTSVFGIILLHILIPIKRPTLQKINVRLFLNAFIIVLIALPPLVYFSWSYVKATSIYNRLAYFYDKFDFFTFLLSNRNVFLKDSFKVYLEDYSFLEKIIGVGQSTYEQMNDFKLVEIDIADIFFTYSFIGLFLFITTLLFVLLQAYLFSKNAEKYPYANLVLLMLFFLFIISTTAGHVFSSGMAGIFIGLLFSLCYIKIPTDKNEVL
ncbi:O-antigen ligase family protein [Mesonia sp.]|uniref:O-antigen ligase family protein n=1 Tax=Mesonia sp. TaxID=1960830 RepID=UPI003F98FF4A